MSKIDPRDLAHDLIQRPILTEKATQNDGIKSIYIRRSPQSDQASLSKQPVEAAMFKVKVIGVNTQNPPRKKRRVGKFVGFKPCYKRATVTFARRRVDPQTAIPRSLANFGF